MQVRELWLQALGPRVLSDGAELEGSPPLAETTRATAKSNTTNASDTANAADTTKSGTTQTPNDASDEVTNWQPLPKYLSSSAVEVDGRPSSLRRSLAPRSPTQPPTPARPSQISCVALYHHHR